MITRIPYDSLTLRAVTDELRRTLTGGSVQHIAQPAPTDLILTIRSRGANSMLLLSCDAAFARVHLVVGKRPNPSVPPAFCMLCRKYLEGARVAAVTQRGFDRILDIHLAAYDGASYRLIAELMGKHSNLLLVSASDTVLDAAKRITRRLSRFREVLPGVPYVAPPAQEGRMDPFTADQAALRALSAGLPADPEAFAARLMAHFEGLSPFLATEIALRAEQSSLEEAWEELIGAAHRGEWLPVVARNALGAPLGAYPFPTVQLPADGQHTRDSINTALDHYYSVALPRAVRDAVAHELATALSRAVKARERQRESLLRSLAESGRAEEYRRMGELLLANLHRIPPKAESITVTDYYAPDAPERVLTLDSALSGQENAEACFRRYRKARDGAAAQQAQLARVEQDLAGLRAAQTRLEETTDVAPLHAMRQELVAAGLLRTEPGSEEGTEARRAPDFEGKKIRVVHTPEGWDIYVGENSEANDYLTGRVAAPNDLWLHVRANTSAHVIIRTANRPDAVPATVLRRAALLAARHSAARHSSLVPVDYTLRKHVRRPRGAASGTAFYRQEKTLYVSPGEEDR